MEQARALAYVKVAEIEVDDVRPDPSGFTLQGQGADRADYRLEWQVDMPMDSRTRAVLGGLLAQSAIRVWRRSKTPAVARRTLRNTGKPGPTTG